MLIFLSDTNYEPNPITSLVLLNRWVPLPIRYVQSYEHTAYVPEVCWNQADITGSNVMILSQFWCYAGSVSQIPAQFWHICPLWLRQPQHIFRPTNHKKVLSANWSPSLIPYWHSYWHQSDYVAVYGQGVSSPVWRLNVDSALIHWDRTRVCFIQRRWLQRNASALPGQKLAGHALWSTWYGVMKWVLNYWCIL